MFNSSLILLRNLCLFYKKKDYLKIFQPCGGRHGLRTLTAHALIPPTRYKELGFIIKENRKRP